MFRWWIRRKLLRRLRSSDPDRRASTLIDCPVDDHRLLCDIAIQTFGDPDSQVRIAATHWLEKSGNLIVTDLLAVLDEASSERRVAALECLGHCPINAAIAPRLLSLLDDSSPDVRREAFLCVAKCADRADRIQSALRFFGDDDSTCHERAKHILVWERAVDELIGLTEAADPRVRAQAIAGLADCGGERAFQIVLRGITDKHPMVREKALAEAGIHHRRDAKPWITRDSMFRIAVNCLDDPALEVRRTAVIIVSGDDDDVNNRMVKEESLRARLNEPDVELLRDVIQALDRLYYFPKTQLEKDLFEEALTHRAKQNGSYECHICGTHAGVFQDMCRECELKQFGNDRFSNS